MKRLVLISLLLGSVALDAGATDLTSSHLLIPIAGRTAGLGGSQWKTDLVVTNASRTGEPETVQIFFIENGSISQPVTALLQPRQTATMVDAIRGAFGKEQATGIILISTRTAEAKITARARIYNTGSAAGQYGQTVPAIPLAKLSKEAFIPGLSGIQGNRTNVGISNPDDTTALAAISIYDSNGEFRGGFGREIAPYSVLQLNDVFSHFDELGPLDGATVQVRSSGGVYAWASIVRNDTGDADFVIGAGTEIDTTHRVVAPQCAAPATLSLGPLPAEGWTVIFKQNVDPFVTTAALEAKYGFTAQQVFNFGGFSALGFSPEAIAALRCETTVRVIEQNSYVPVF